MRTATLAALGLLLATPLAAAPITTRTCTCALVPQNITADIVSADYVEPSDEEQAELQRLDDLHEPPAGSAFLRHLVTCVDATTPLVVTGPDWQPYPFVMPHVTEPDRPVPEPGVWSLLACGAVSLWWRRRA